MNNRDEGRKFFNLSENTFGGHVTDPKIRAAFEEKAFIAEEKRDIPGIMLAIKDGWDKEQIAALATAPIDEYRKAFKMYFGSNFRRMPSNVFQFDRVAGASETMQEIPRRAREALRQIGAESPINARRVRRFGVKLEEPEEPLDEGPGS